MAPAPPKVQLADLLGKRKEPEHLMNYQKTKKSRDKKRWRRGLQRRERQVS